MSERIKILHLEDDADYAVFVRESLNSHGLAADLIWVNNARDFKTRLAQDTFDLILADYSLPDITGLQALTYVLEQAHDIPFLLLSGTIGEQAAVESLRAGATDYVLKQWPERLAPAIRRAVEQARERQLRRHVEAELTRCDKYLRALTEHSLDLLTILDPEARIRYSSPSVTRILGYSQKELDGQLVFDLVHPDDVNDLRALFLRNISQPGVRLDVRARVRHQDGRWVHLEAVVQNCVDDPDLAGVVINSRDVSERIQAEAELRESERQYRIFFHDNPDPMWVFEPNTLAVLEVNAAAVSQYGYDREEFLNLKVTELRPAEDVPAFLEFLADFQSERSDHRLGGPSIWRHRRKNGETLMAEVKWSGLNFRSQPAILCLAHDVTGRLRAQQQEAAMARLGRQLNSATTQAEAARLIHAVADELFGGDVFTLFVCEEGVDEVSQVLAIDTIAGRRVELPEDPALRVMSPRTKRILRDGAELVLREKDAPPAHDTLMMGDKARHSQSLMYAPVRNGQRGIGVLSVQSYSTHAYEERQLRLFQVLADYCGGALERIRAQQTSRDNEQRFRELFDGSPDAIFVEDETGQVLDVNPAGCALHGMTRQELVGRNVRELVPPHRQAEVREHFARLVKGELSRVEGESWGAAGELIPVEVRAGRIHYAGKPALLLHVRDITERRQAEMALRSSELLFYSVWENSVVGMRLTDESGRIVAVNEAYCRLVGLERERLQDHPCTTGLAKAADSASLLAAHETCFRERRVEAPMELHLTLSDGSSVVWEQTQSFVELRGQPPLLLAMFRDVTEQHRLEEQLRQSQKMEAIGQLAGGVAHDFNNILTVIHGHASLLLTGQSLTQSATRSAQQITHAAERAAGLTRQLLAFSRRQVMQAQLLDFNEVVSSMARMLARILGEDVALSVNYASQPPMVLADQSMMEQVLMNLAVNARDAMPKGGELAVTIAITTVDDVHAARHSDARAGDFVRLSVRDTGTGIAPEHLHHIFEPFFTTKEQGRGTGLGLATVYGVVKQHQGWIEVDSQVDHGTIFSVYFPLTQRTQLSPSSPPTELNIRGGDETVLLVEDELEVRNMVARLLRSYGYQVIEAHSGVAALEAWQSQREQVHLLLTDIVMPGGVNGRELAETLQSQRPTLPVIYMSGYSADVLGQEFALRPGLNYLQKPFHPRKIAQAVRESLDERALLARG